MNANSARRSPSSTRRALASLAVQPWRLAMRFRRLPLSAGRRMLTTIDCGELIRFTLTRTGEAEIKEREEICPAKRQEFNALLPG